MDFDDYKQTQLVTNGLLVFVEFTLIGTCLYVPTKRTRARGCLSVLESTLERPRETNYKTRGPMRCQPMLPNLFRSVVLTWSLKMKSSCDMGTA